MKSLVLGALLLAACGGGAVGAADPMESFQPDGAAVATSDACPEICGGSGAGTPFACVVAIDGVANPCSASPKAGYFVCCAYDAEGATTVNTVTVPGGAADTCTQRGPGCQATRASDCAGGTGSAIVCCATSDAGYCVQQ